MGLLDGEAEGGFEGVTLGGPEGDAGESLCLVCYVVRERGGRVCEILYAATYLRDNDFDKSNASQSVSQSVMNLSP